MGGRIREMSWTREDKKDKKEREEVARGNQGLGIKINDVNGQRESRMLPDFRNRMIIIVSSPDIIKRTSRIDYFRYRLSAKWTR